MLSSRFLVASFLYIFYAARLVTASPHHQPGGDNQVCQNVKTVTVTMTVAPSQSSPPTNKGQPSAGDNQPGKVKLKNGGGNTKTTSAVKDGQTPTVKNGNTDPSSGNGKTNPTSTSPADDGKLALDPSVIQKIDGKGQDGEADSLVSPNNFINSCVGKTLTNGKQVRTGSCNPVPMGDIPSVDKMPSAKFTSPKNFDTIAADTPFTVSLKVNNMVTGSFTNADNTYYAAPQELVGGAVKGHSHITVQQMTSLNSNEPLDPKVFAFFKGLNGVAQNGILSADVAKGLPKGVYRISSINSASNHQEVLGPVAQRGSFNDVIYITVADGGGDPSPAPPADTSSTSLPVPSSTDKDGKGGKKNGKGGDVLSTSSAPPQSTPPPSGSGRPDTMDQPKSKGGKNDNKGSQVLSTSTSSAVPASTDVYGKGRKKNGKGGDTLSTSSTPPESTPPPSGSGKPNTKDQANGKGEKQPQGNNYQYPKRMHRRSSSP